MTKQNTAAASSPPSTRPTESKHKVATPLPPVPPEARFGLALRLQPDDEPKYISDEGRGALQTIFVNMATSVVQTILGFRGSSSVKDMPKDDLGEPNTRALNRHVIRALTTIYPRYRPVAKLDRSVFAPATVTDIKNMFRAFVKASDLEGDVVIADDLCIHVGTFLVWYYRKFIEGLSRRAESTVVDADLAHSYYSFFLCAAGDSLSIGDSMKAYNAWVSSVRSVNRRNRELAKKRKADRDAAEGSDESGASDDDDGDSEDAPPPAKRQKTSGKKKAPAKQQQKKRKKKASKKQGPVPMEDVDEDDDGTGITDAQLNGEAMQEEE